MYQDSWHRVRCWRTSSLSEGISLTILEAMASGLPVVATSVGGNPEVVVNGGTGLLVPSGKPREMADALLMMWRSPAKRAEYGEAGKHRVKELFDIRHTVAEYELLYDRVVSNTRREPF